MVEHLFRWFTLSGLLRNYSDEVDFELLILTPEAESESGQTEGEREWDLDQQAWKLKFRLRDLTSYLCSAAAPAVCLKGRVAGVDATERGNVVSQLKF